MARFDSAQWRDMMEYLRRRHAPICRQWFEQLHPLELDSGLLLIRTSSSVQQAYLQRKCAEPFTEAAQAVTGALVAVRFVNGQDGSAASGRGAAAHAAAGTEEWPADNGGAATATLEADHEQILLVPDYVFETFVTGPCNRLAYAAAVAVANQPGVAYNPLFIHGGVGLGKTHLLQGICQRIMQRHSAARICYLSCDAFMNRFLESVQTNRMAEFRNRYRDADVLVIDDIHFLARRDRSQEEFFHTFNALYQHKKQIVLSSDSPPSEIPQLEERLVSRFQWGLVANVTKPCFETRVAIVKSKSQLRGVELPEDVVSYIATKIESNARELEGAINAIQSRAAFENRPITLELAEEALGEPKLQAARTQFTLQNVIDAVTSFYNVRLSDLQSKRRHKSITLPRQVCMWLARKRTRFSLQEIGGYFGGRDHTTVMHSIAMVEQRLQQDPSFAQEIKAIESQLEEPAT